jgi:hypothetical protein
MTYFKKSLFKNNAIGEKQSLENVSTVFGNSELIPDADCMISENATVITNSKTSKS